MDKYLARKASVNKYLAWKASVNEYLAWKASVNEQINNSNASAPAQESGFWKDRRDKKKKDPKKDYSMSASDQGKGESASSEAGDGGAAAQDPAPASFVRGDVNQDGQVSIQDVDALLQHIYNKDHEPACLESADVNNDGEVRLGDALQLITYVTHGLFSPAAPFPACGRDPDGEGSWGDIGCVSYELCPEEGETEALEEDAD